MDSQHFGDVMEASKGRKSLISLFSLLMLGALHNLQASRPYGCLQLSNPFHPKLLLSRHALVDLVASILRALTWKEYPRENNKKVANFH